MRLLKNKKLLSVLLLVVPLAIGIPIAMFIIPAGKPRIIVPENSHFEFTSKLKDSVEIKLDLILTELKQIDERLKKIESAKIVTKDSLKQNAKSTNRNMQTKKDNNKSIQDKQKKQSTLMK